MAHCMKYTKASCGALMGHYDRSKQNYGNENIDSSRTHLNYNLAEQVQPLRQGDYMRARAEHVHVLNRKDVNVMCDWVITAPQDLPADELGAFFKASFDFCSSRYGAENVISAYVHMDEVSPHMHFAFMPVVYDAKKDRLKLSACEVINRTELQQFHPALQEAVEQALGHKVAILNGATVEGNKSIAELKRLTAPTRLIEEQNRVEAVESTLKAQKAEIEANRALLREVTAKADTTTPPKRKKSLLGEETVTIPASRYDQLIERESWISGVMESNKSLKASLAAQANSRPNARIRKLEGDLQDLKFINAKLKAELSNKARAYDNLKARIDKALEQVSDKAYEEFKIAYEAQTKSHHRTL